MRLLNAVLEKDTPSVEEAIELVEQIHERNRSSTRSHLRKHASHPDPPP